MRNRFFIQILLIASAASSCTPIARVILGMQKPQEISKLEAYDYFGEKGYDSFPILAFKQEDLYKHLELNPTLNDVFVVNAEGFRVLDTFVSEGCTDYLSVVKSLHSEKGSIEVSEDSSLVFLKKTYFLKNPDSSIFISPIDQTHEYTVFLSFATWGGKLNEQYLDSWLSELKFIKGDYSIRLLCYDTFLEVE
jgi:hypothetical protein